MHVKELTVDSNEEEARNSIDNAVAEGLIIVGFCNAFVRNKPPTQVFIFLFPKARNGRKKMKMKRVTRVD
jgi:hypothetical protein